MNSEILDFEVFLIEKVAERLFSGDSVTAYKKLKNAGILDYYSETYDTSHTLGTQYLLDEVEDMLRSSK